MYRTIPCDGKCFECRHPDCIANYSATGRTPFEIEQANLVKAKKAESRRREREEKRRNQESSRWYSRWLKKNHIKKESEEPENE